MSATPGFADRIARILDKVRARKICLGPPLSEEEICRFERRHNITLPVSYRSFLLHVGNGGLGPPYYGLRELGNASGDMRQEEARIWTELPFIRERFPFTKTWCWESDELSDEGTRDQTAHGCLYVGNDGCGQYWFLIVTGEERGNVWMTCGEGTTPTGPKRDFLQWYEDWLDGNRDWWG